MAKTEWIAVVDGKVLEVGGKRAATNLVKKYPHAKTEIVQVGKGEFVFGDKYPRGDVKTGDVLPPEDQQDMEAKGNRMARGTRRRNKPANTDTGDTAVMDKPETETPKRDKPQATALEDRRNEDQPVDFTDDKNADAAKGGNKPDGSDSKGEKKAKKKPWEAGENAEWLQKKADELREIGERLASEAEIKEAATKTREDWLDYGTILSDARRVVKSNNLFNEWLKAEGLEDYADRNSRTDAMWLADQPDGVIDAIPETLHSPKAIRDWYRKHVASIAEYLNSIEGDLAEQIAALDEDDPAKAAFARAIEAHEAKREDSKKTLPQAIEKASKKKPRLEFANLTVEAAAQWIVDKIKTHDLAEDIGELLVNMIEEQQALVPTEGDTGDGEEAEEGNEDDVDPEDEEDEEDVEE